MSDAPSNTNHIADAQPPTRQEVIDAVMGAISGFIGVDAFTPEQEADAMGEAEFAADKLGLMDDERATVLARQKAEGLAKFDAMMAITA